MLKTLKISEIHVHDCLDIKNQIVKFFSRRKGDMMDNLNKEIADLKIREKNSWKKLLN